MARQCWHKAPQWLFTPDEIHEMVPIINMDGILGGLFNPGELMLILSDNLCLYTV
jgi:dimethylglycine dehydrogenase